MRVYGQNATCAIGIDISIDKLTWWMLTDEEEFLHLKLSVLTKLLRTIACLGDLNKDFLASIIQRSVWLWMVPT